MELYYKIIFDNSTIYDKSIMATVLKLLATSFTFEGQQTETEKTILLLLNTCFEDDRG
jgi:hypothetical protein